MYGLSIGLLIIGLNFKILFAMVVMIWRCSVFIFSDIAIITALFLASANLTQFICKKIQCLTIVGIYKMYMNKINIKNRVIITIILTTESKRKN